jgi:hypothetical protein
MRNLESTVGPPLEVEDIKAYDQNLLSNFISDFSAKV